jgi:glycosyltransferase involved in cell wall biosynthesis
MIIPSFYPATGGAEIQVKQLAKAYMAQGWSVQVLTRSHSHNGSNLPARDMVENIPVTRVNNRGGRIAAITYIFSALYYLMLHGRKAVYHAHDIGADGWLAVIAGKLLGGYSVIKLRSGRLGYEERLHSRLDRWQFSKLTHWADRVVVVNKEVEEMVRDLGIPDRQVVRIPNGVDTSYFFPPTAQIKAETRQRLGLPPGKTVTLYVGRLVPIKGLDVLLRGWALLPENLRSHALLLIVGDGTKREELKLMVQSLGLQMSVIFEGEQQAVRDYYQAADIFVLPSRSEGLSGSLVEAMACGLPVVVSRVGGALDLVHEAEHGTFFDSEDYRELAQRLIEITVAKYSWPEMGARARQSVKDYANLDTVSQRLLDLYSELA